MVHHVAARTTLPTEQRERWSRAMAGINVQPLGLDVLDVTTIQPLTDELPLKHHLDGATSATSPPMLLFRLPHLVRSKLLQPDTVRFMPYGWDGVFGSMLTVTAWVPSEEPTSVSKVRTRLCIRPRDAAFQNLKAGRFSAAFAQNQRVVFACTVDLNGSFQSEEWFSEQWNRVANHVAAVPDAAAHYWEILGNLIDVSEPWLTPSDRLSLGWFRWYARAVHALCSSLAGAKKENPFPLFRDAGLPPRVVSFLEAIEAAQFTPQPVLDHMRSVHAGGDEGLLDLWKGYPAFETFARANAGDAVRSLFELFFSVYLRTPHLTKCGTALPWADLSNGFSIRQLDLKPKEFRKGFDPIDFWSRLPASLFPSWGHLITGEEVPVSPHELVAACAGLPLAEDVLNVNASADALLDEAIAHKKWTIPNRAIVEQRLGPFTHMEVFEASRTVHFVCRTESGEFCIVFVEPDNRYCSSGVVELLGLESDPAARIQAGVKLLLSAIIRDFWVVEEREAVFSHRLITTKLPGERREPSGPRIVYLPRIRYIDRPNLDRCASQLDHHERRAHFVRAHERKVEHPSAHQLFLAQRYSYAVRPGYTFVRPHERGKKQQDVVYRSRSALHSLYTAMPSAGASDGPTRWFRFEKDVYRLMAALGFTVEHIAASQRGDHGVDVFATKGRDLETVYWVIQCKCYGRRKVGPAIVRELVGALRINRDGYPVGTRGMIVTTSTFTIEALEEGSQAGIRLMDGAEFARLLCDAKGNA